ncbi:MAG: FxDxF family PEP-CTERM protein [Pseudomonadota bacterium]
MKNSKSLLAAVVVAGASMASSFASAADIFELDVLDNSAHFGSTFAMDNEGQTFSDRFVFEIENRPANLDAIVSSISRAADMGLDITGLNLYRDNGALVATGTASQTGATDVWTVSTDNLTRGSYYLAVSGNMAGDTGGSFGGAMMLAPVPEPATYGMLLGGLGLLGFMARRRKGGK